MDLPSFIRSLGIEESAALFDETPRQIRAWLYQERAPKPQAALKIEERTKGHPVGRVRFHEIYASQ